MKPRLQTSLGQQLVLTPQLRQALHLLQLPVLDLEAEISAAVESNPLLEWIEDAAVTTPPVDVRHQGEPADPPATAGNGDAAHGNDWEGASDFAWERSGHRPDDATEQLADEGTLQDHLLWQLHLAPCNERDCHIALALIESIDEDGYLRDPPDEITSNLPHGIQADDDDLARNLRLVQSMDPAGVGARDLGECLRLQLLRRSPDTPGHALALRIAEGDLEHLPKAGAEGLARRLDAAVADVEQALQLLRGLDPRPGARHGALPQDCYVVPDCVIGRQHGVWTVRLSRDPLARLGIHRAYEQLAASSSGDDGRYLRGHLQEARWLLKNLESRGQTLLKIVNCLLREQSAFLEYGPRALRPLTLREIAAQVDLHESTVSRAIAGKYARTPRGTVALRDFFASGVAGGEAGEASSTAIQEMIRALVAAEDPRKPLSDAHLARTLSERGINVARRTVAKYREAIGIDSSQQRVRLG
ncbi:MAG: RNA polymerase factor sigma-54 [Pseudoxanthomonas suwonensis]|nr:RNA polymerase factor sigma-54 [Pseudoxanthomonas suwonensis]